MAGYQFNDIEKKWQQYWEENEAFKASLDTTKPKYYSLDMFPYPSGAGLHVGHPLGYIASDIISRYKRINGFNVLHPMGFDAFGLPAEQYAIQTGQHPAITTEQNIKRYKEQLKNIGFSFDWEKQVETCDPNYYKWTQWIFSKLFDSWYNYDTAKAEHIDSLIAVFKKSGNTSVNAECGEEVIDFSAEDWKVFDEKQQSDILLQYRLTYLAETSVNWCPELGTVLSNDEVKDGFSERGGYPVIRKNMMQWSMRITAYAERLLEGLERIDWPEPLRDMQRNWIGKSIGAEVTFKAGEVDIPVFTTRLDTIYGVTYLAVAPESDFVDQLTTSDQKEVVKEYVAVAKNRSERDRMSDVKNISGVFLGSYAEHPFTGEQVQVWVADYVLSGYGTGAVMAVPSGDQRDYDFAKHFDLPIIPVYDNQNIKEQADPRKDGKLINSGILNGFTYSEAIKKATDYIEEKNIGTAKINYRIRDAIFARQRYWGEPVPIYFDNGIPKLVDSNDLPVVLPEVDKYLPTEDGDPPLGRAEDFTYTPSGSTESYPLELSTMPGWAGSSWYWFRYMEANNDNEFVSKDAQEYWQAVDLYIGGSEHATGHLLYSRFWCKFLYDMGLVQEDEPFKKLINQGMIQGRSNFVYRINGTNTFVSHNLRKEHKCTRMHVDVNIVYNDELDLNAFKVWRPDLKDSEFILEDGKYHCGVEVEKMSKSKYNVVSPDDIVSKYGADTLRLYEMFLGPLEQFKPWNTNGIDGVYKFLRKMWNLFHDDNELLNISEEKATKEELKSIHKTIKKVQEDIERYSFNTPVSAFMICVNELTTLKCNKREVLEPLTMIVSPYAPHIAEELWKLLGHEGGVTNADFPSFDEAYLKEDAHEYPISINGKMRVKIKFPFDMPKSEIEKEVLESEAVQKWTEGKTPKKVIIIPNKIVNIVV
jgi:leucyl-tRNA synthetase